MKSRAEPDLTTTAAIALWGRHPMMLIGGKAPGPAAEIARAMAEALPNMTPGQTRERATILKRAGNSDDAGRRPRAIEPTPGDPVLGESGRPGCAELAHGGILAAEDLQTWKEQEIAETLIAALRGITMTRRKRIIHCDCRVTASTTGCKCSSRDDHCQCSDDDRALATQSLWYASAYLLFDIARPGPDTPGQIDTAQLRELYTRARRFAITTRDQPRANARTATIDQPKGWTMTGEARRKFTRTQYHPIDRERIVQVSRSCADLDETRRIQERHIDTALSLTTVQRIHGFR